MTKRTALKKIQAARLHLVCQRQDGLWGDKYSGNEAYRSAYAILMWAEDQLRKDK